MPVTNVTDWSRPPTRAPSRLAPSVRSLGRGGERPDEDDAAEEHRQAGQDAHDRGLGGIGKESESGKIEDVVKRQAPHRPV